MKQFHFEFVEGWVDVWVKLFLVTPEKYILGATE